MLCAHVCIKLTFRYLLLRYIFSSNLYNTYMYTEFKNHEYGITDTSRIHKLPFINVVDKFCYVMRI